MESNAFETIDIGDGYIVITTKIVKILSIVPESVNPCSFLQTHVMRLMVFPYFYLLRNSVSYTFLS